MSDSTDRIKLIGLPDELTKLLGEISARAGQFEYLFAVTIRRTVGFSMIEAFDYAKKLWSRKEVMKSMQEGLIAWAAEQGADIDVDELVNRIRELLRQRDELVAHCCWGIDKNDGKLRYFRHGEPADFGIKALGELAHKMREALRDLNVAVRPDLLWPSGEGWQDSIEPAALESYITLPDWEVEVSAMPFRRAK